MPADLTTEHLWMPFTANRQFKNKPAMLVSASGMHYTSDAGRKIRDGEVVTACQAACPTEAITFGDISDPNSKIAKAKKDHRNYILLNELNTQPRTTYLAGLKNQNKEMPDYKAPVKKASAAPKAETKTAGGEGH